METHTTQQHISHNQATENFTSTTKKHTYTTYTYLSAHQATHICQAKERRKEREKTKKQERTKDERKNMTNNFWLTKTTSRIKFQNG